MGIRDALEDARAQRAGERVYEAQVLPPHPIHAPADILCTEEVPGIDGMTTRLSERMPLNHMQACRTMRHDWEGTKLRRRAYASGAAHPAELEAEMHQDHPRAAAGLYTLGTMGPSPHSTRESILFSRDKERVMEAEMMHARERGVARAMDQPKPLLVHSAQRFSEETTRVDELTEQAKRIDELHTPAAAEGAARGAFEGPYGYPGFAHGYAAHPGFGYGHPASFPQGQGHFGMGSHAHPAGQMAGPGYGYPGSYPGMGRGYGP